MIFIKDSLVFDTDKSELLYSKDIRNDSWVFSKEDFYVTQNGIFFEIDVRRTRKGLFNKTFGDTEYICFPRSLKSMCYCIDQFPQDIKEKFAERFLKKTWKENKSNKEKGEKEMEANNYEKTLTLKKEYEDLKLQLEDIKRKMLTVKQKAKDELNWILNDKIEE